jgi:hypothetical protein
MLFELVARGGDGPWWHASRAVSRPHPVLERPTVLSDPYLQSAHISIAPSLPGLFPRSHAPSLSRALSRARRRSHGSHRSAAGLDPPLSSATLRALPRLSVAPRLLAGLLSPQVDWAALQASADTHLRPARLAAKGAFPHHSALRWPAVEGERELRPSLRKTTSLPGLSGSR